MRILHVDTVNAVAYAYAGILERRGHICAVERPSLKGASGSLPVKLANMPGRVLDLRRITRLLTPDRFDIAHIQWASYGVLGLAGHIPYVVQCHGSDVRYRATDPRFRPVLRQIFRRAGAVLYMTPDLREPVCSLRADAQFVPTVIDTDHFMPAVSGESRPWTIFLFSRLERLKGAPMAVSALERFVTRHPDTCVRLLDYGSLRDAYKRRYSGTFQFLPITTPDRVREYIWEADVVLGQTFLGALGLSELQAMACGKPVITNYRYPSAYPSAPPIHDAQTADEIEAALEALYQDREAAASLGRRARDWVVAYHHADVIAERLEGIYGTVLRAC